MKLISLNKKGQESNKERGDPLAAASWKQVLIVLIVCGGGQCCGVIPEGLQE